VTSANDNPTTTSSTPVGTTAAVNNLPVAEAIHAETVGNDVENRVGTMEDTIRQLNSQLQNIVYAEQVQVKDDDGDGNDDGGAAAAEGVWTKRKPMIISILAVLIAGIAIAVALTMMGKKPDSATADSSVTSTPLPTGSDVSTAPDATPAPSVFSGDEKPATVIFKFSKMLNDLQMTLFGISELPPDSQTVWEEFTKVFSEQIISDSVDDFVTSYTVVDVFQPASKRQRQLKGERGHRDLQDGDGVRVQYTQYIEFATTDELITPLSLAILPFQTEESRAAYVSFLQRSEDSVLQMVTSSTNVSIQETWESPTSPSPTQRPVTEPTPQPVTPQPVTGPTTPSPTAATASPTRQPTPPPAPAPTPPPTNSPTRRPTVSPTPRPVDPVPVYANPECQELCGSIATGVPVTTTGRAEFQAAILEYLKDPSSSPYGSTINCWDVSRVTDMSYAFSYHESRANHNRDPLFNAFNEPLNCWDTSSVTTMEAMFRGNKSFNQPIESWDVSSVKTLEYMFYEADGFNQPLNGWDVSAVTNMRGVFMFQDRFNQPLDKWDVSSVVYMDDMFWDNDVFNQDLSGWDVSNVIDMHRMFDGCLVFDQPIGSWDVSKVTDMSFMFKNAKIFNQPLSNWDTSSVTTMFRMFDGDEEFNQDISAWDLSSLTEMSEMFRGSSSFNQNLCAWNSKFSFSLADFATDMFVLTSCPNQGTPTSSNWCQPCS